MIDIVALGLLCLQTSFGPRFHGFDEYQFQIVSFHLLVKGQTVRSTCTVPTVVCVL
jgi:hypothetical protein